MSNFNYKNVSFRKDLTDILNNMSDDLLTIFMSGEEDVDINNIETLSNSCGIDIENDDIEQINKINNLNIKSQFVKQFGGEGKGDDYYSIFRFYNDFEELFVKFDGYYSSYDDSSFSSWFYVYPEQVLITEYFEIK